MSRVFLDTACFVANVNRRDQYYVNAKELLNSFLEQGRQLITTEWVLMEAGGGLSRPALREEFIEFAQLLQRSGYLLIEPATTEIFARSWEVFSQRPDKSWSLVDCSSFITMQNLGIRDAFTADQHFVQAGFHALLLQGQ
jgi:predicted nucleic acid-binding protein